MASKSADGKREVTDHLGQIAAGERWKRRIEPQPPAANQPARIRPINSAETSPQRHGLGHRKATLHNERFLPQNGSVGLISPNQSSPEVPETAEIFSHRV